MQSCSKSAAMFTDFGTGYVPDRKVGARQNMPMSYVCRMRICCRSLLRHMLKSVSSDTTLHGFVRVCALARAGRCALSGLPTFALAADSAFQTLHIFTSETSRLQDVIFRERCRASAHRHVTPPDTTAGRCENRAAARSTSIAAVTCGHYVRGITFEND